MNNLYVVFDEFEEANNKKERMVVIEKNLSKLLVDVLQLTYHPDSQWLVHDMPEQIRFIRGMRAYAGFKQIGVTYERAERAAGEVKYTFKKLVQLALDGLFGFSSFPLRLSTYLGISIAIPSLIIGVFFLVHRLFGFKVFGHTPEETPGLASLAVGMFFLGGVMLTMLGIIGEYISRIYIEVKKRPFFVIDEIIEKK